MGGLGGGEPHKLGFPKLLMEEMQGWRGVIDGVHRVSMASIPHTREGLTARALTINAEALAISAEEYDYQFPLKYFQLF